MALSVGDSKKRLNEFFLNNHFLNNIFSNILIVSILIVFLNIFLIYYHTDIEEGFIKLGIWSLLGTILLLLMHNKTIKLYHNKKIKGEAEEEFKNMMEKNTNELIAKGEIDNEVRGRNEIESDIIKFLDR
jgi:hypothetical protein